MKNSLLTMRLACAVFFAVGCSSTPVLAQVTPLADQPIGSATNVPGNLALVLSVEFPTAISVANINSYSDTTTYIGYFDPAKCYTYQYNTLLPATSYFQPAGAGLTSSGHQCSGQWSGNFMNWATMQTIDPFRSVLTGGYRSVDTLTTTILEKAWGSQQGSANSNFNYRGTSLSDPNTLSRSLISAVTPFTKWSNFNTGIWGNGNQMVFTAGSNYTTQSNDPSAIDFNDVASANTSSASSKTWQLYVRVKVCDPTIGVEPNCVQYGTNYKPQGLLQTYANKVRFAVFSYLNQSAKTRQGGVLREPMGFIGPTYQLPTSSLPIANTRPEWDPVTGIMSTNPDTVNALLSGVTQSGVMNYLNKFGEFSQTYEHYDNVSELYYAAVRYFENLGNVPEWTNNATATELDGFPAVTAWTGVNSAGVANDPIMYSCQNNFILGIGDDHTWNDYNVGGVTNASGSRPVPSAVAADTFNKATTWTTNAQNLEGISPTPWWRYPSSTASTLATYFMAGLAYGTHVLDIRPDLTGTQTISTYWMDVEEGGTPEDYNPYYLATKYGGFTVPSGYSMSNTTPLPTTQWDTLNTVVPMNPSAGPDNYFMAGNAAGMKTGLQNAFLKIANTSSVYGTALATPGVTVAAGSLSYSSLYSPTGWTGTVAATTITLGTSNPTFGTSPTWTTNSTLQSQLSGTGWNTGRRVVTFNGTQGTPFRVGSLTAAQLAALLPSYSSGPTATTAETNYLNYLRGDQTNEVGSSVTGSTQSLRPRTLLLGDIVDASLAVVGTPSENFSETANPGYTAFKNTSTASSRPTMVYAGANDGMLHAFVGTTGAEQFAYIPSALFQGPTATPQVNGLAALGNPNFTHYNYVDATPIAYDVDYNRTVGNSGTSPNWATLLIGGLGKGGKSFYAIDVTNPAAITTEATAAAAVKWEFTDATMGYSYGKPIAFKTAQYGWVIAFTSGYNSSSTLGYLYLVNPVTGALLQKIATSLPSSGLTQASAYTSDHSDNTADSVYVGDLNGQVWRFDLTTTGTSGTYLTANSVTYPAATQLATLTDVNGISEPVTVAPLIEVHPTTRRRYLMIGTGKYLDPSDATTTTPQNSFYAIIDGTSTAFSSFPLPLTRLSLTAVTSVTAGLTASPTSKGWYVDLGAASSGVAWRMNVQPVAYNGVVAFAALLPTATACLPGGTSEVYGLNYATATSILTNAPLGYVSFNSPVVNMAYLAPSGSGSSGNSAQLDASTAAGQTYQIPVTTSAGLGTRLLNWRELPSAN